MKDKFYFNDLQNTFIGKIEIFNQNIEMEIKLNESELNWAEVEHFVTSLDDEYMPKVIDTSAKLLTEFIKLVCFGVKEPFNAYDFRLEGVVYYGKVDNRVFSGLVDGFELLFKLYHSDHIECNDPYGNYTVRIDNRLITGIRREQV